MQIREFARVVVESKDLAAKLAPPPRLADDSPGPQLLLLEPGRPERLRMLAGRSARVPRVEGMADPAQRPRILHALANHELQATELFAWALLAFPQAPADFRRGLLRILCDEQRHTRMYLARLAHAGAAFGDHPVHGYFWRKVPQLTTPLRFICAMSLTFENANLDHTFDYALAARRAGDPRTALVIERVHRDEVRHVRFGWTWLQRWKGEGATAWDAFTANLAWPLRPARARGRTFHRQGREDAGLDPDFIRRLDLAR